MDELATPSVSGEGSGEVPGEAGPGPNDDSSQPEIATVEWIQHQMVSHYYIPPVNYGLVEDDLYRSGQPNELNFPFLERLGLKNVLYLASEDPPQS
jgi:hypothetical protein